MAFRLLAVALALLAVLGLFELGLRWAPGSEPAPPSDFGRQVRHGDDRPDFRGRHYTWGSERRRVVVVGDSFTWGWGLAAGRSYPDRLQALLRERLGSEAIDVVNFSRPGWNTAMEITAFRRSFTEVRPDLLILSYCLNDAEPSSQAELDRRRRGLAPTSPSHPVSVFLIRHSAAYSWIHARLDTAIRSRALRSYYRELYEADAPGWAATREAIAVLAEMADEWRVPLLVAILPIFDSRLGDGYPFAGLHDRVREAAEAVGAEVLDLRSVYADQEPRDMALVPFSDAHPSAAAHDLAATAVMAHLDRTRKLPLLID